MSMNRPTQVCTLEDKLIVQDKQTGEVVYTYCTVHGLESISPLFALFFPEVVKLVKEQRDNLIEKAMSKAKDPHYQMELVSAEQAIGIDPDGSLLN